MPTFDSSVNLIPTEYVPIDYRHDAQFALAEAQQATQNIAMVKSRYEDLLGMDLTTDKSKTTLSTYMKGAEENLQKIAGMNMMVYDNAKQALDIFKPLTDTNGEYSFIAGDHAYTQKVKSTLSQVEQSKYTDKGAAYNPALEEILNTKLNVFSKLNKPEDWKYFYANTQDYIPGYNYQEEKAKLDERFLKMIDKGIENEAPTGNGYIETFKDESIYADKYREFLEANLSPQAKQQMKLEKQAEYWKNLSVVALTKDPVKQLEAKNALTAQYIKTYQDDINLRLDNANEVKTKLELYKKMSDANNPGFIKSIDEELGVVDSRIKELQGKKITEKDVEPMLDINNWANGEEAYSNFFLDKELTKMANAEAMSRGSHTYKSDDAYWHLQNLNLGYARLAQEDKWKQQEHLDKLLELSMKTAEAAPETYTTYDPITGAQVESSADAGKQQMEKDAAEVVNSKSSFGVLEQMTGLEFNYKPEEQTELQGITFAEAIKRNLVRGDNQVLNDLLKVINIPTGNGKTRKINPNTDNASQVLTWLKTASLDNRYVDFLTAQYAKDPAKAKVFNQVKVQMTINNSQAGLIDEKYKQAVVDGLKDVRTKDGASFLDMGYDISTTEKLQLALDKFSQISSYSKSDLMDKVYESYGKLSSSKAASSGYTEWSRRPAEDPKKKYDSSILRLVNNGSSSLLNDFVGQFYKNVTEYGERGDGYVVKFGTNMGEGEAKTLLASYNNMANQNDQDEFAPVATMLDAVNQVNAYFEKHAIPTNAIDPNRFKVDQNSLGLQQGHRYSVVDLNGAKLKTIYGIANSKPINVSVYNANPRGTSAQLDIKIDGQYPVVKLATDGITILRNGDGSVQLDYVYASDMKNRYVTQLQAKGYTLAQATAKANEDLSKKITDNMTALGTTVLGNLELIKYLNGEGKGLGKLTNDLRSKYL
jgi:hypothetical protein